MDENIPSYISFEFSFDKLPERCKALLVEAYYKCEELTRYITYLDSEIYDEISCLYISKGINATTSIEGSTLNDEQAKELFYEKRTNSPELASEESPPKEWSKVDESEPMFRNIQEVYSDISQESASLSVERLCAINGKVLRGLKVGKNVRRGEIRNHSILVGTDRGAHASQCENLLRQLFKWLEGRDFASPSDNPLKKFQKGVVQAILAQLYILHIHPFGDGNGRTARAVEVQILTRYGVPGISTQILANHYNLTRPDYYEEIEKSRKPKDKEIPRPDNFIFYALKGFVDGLTSQVEHIATKQAEINKERHWKMLVEEKYKGSLTQTGRRQLEIAYALPLNKETPIPEIRLLSPDIAKLYGKMTTKTITRDVNDLEEKGLIKKSETGITPDTSLLKNELKITGWLSNE